MENYFKSIVKRYKLKLKDITTVLNKSYSTLTHYVDGSRHPDLETFIILAKYLNVSLDELLDVQTTTSEEVVILSKHDYEIMKQLIDKLNKIINKK